MAAIWQQINQEAAETVHRVQRGLVQILADERGIGAGVVWNSDGLIVTNAHVVLAPRHGALHVQYLEQHQVEAQVLAIDEQRDLALLQVAGDHLTGIQIGQSANVQVGQWLMALGHPWGVVNGLTAGIVIGKGADLPEVSDGREWLALDMQMRPGHSGGALFDSNGYLVGINTMIRGPEVSFAVPVDTVQIFVDEALAKLGSQSSAQEAVIV